MKASFSRNVGIVFAFLMIVNSTAAALDFPLSIGLGLDVIPSSAFGKAITKEEYSKPNETLEPESE
ncbi:hypothetical protein AGMMS50212_01390 [Spirochaetia bacterium]|nr:hypothetical protein AGMMS50212_01390 [Spirochaetia bacterium]